jgi:predicted ATP-binding protein involved in virulence
MSRTIIVGRSGSGKTTLLIELLKKLPREKLEIILISPTAGKQELYTENEDLFDDYFTVLNDTVVQKLGDTVEKFKKKKGHRKEVVAIFDDVGEDAYFLKTKNKLTELTVSARHLPIHLIFLIQKVKQLRPIYRLNADEAYIFKPTSEDERKIILNDFFDDFTKEMFEKLENIAWKKPYDYIRMKREGGSTSLYLNDGETPIDLEKTLI